MDQIFAFLDKLAMNQGVALLCGAIAFALLLLCVCVSVVSGRLQTRQVVNGLCDTVVLAAAAALLGFGLSKVGAEGGAGKALYYASVAAGAVLAVVRYVIGRKRLVREVSSTALRKSAASGAATRFAFSRLYGAALCLVLVAAMQLAMGGQAFVMPLFMVAVLVVALMLHKVARVRFWYWAAFLTILLFVLICSKIYYTEALAVNMPVAAASAVVLATVFASLTTLSITKE